MMSQSVGSMKLAGKVAVVAGGSQGIGEAVAVCLAEQGAKVAVMASSDVAKLARVARKLSSAGGDSYGGACDISIPSAVTGFIDQVTTRLGEVDILVNTAGLYYPTPAGATDVDAVNRIVDVNLKGSWHLINCVVPQMRQRRYGKIVNFASAAGLVGFSGYALYCASKAAVIMMTRALAIELAPFGINVNCVAPGPTATSMNEQLRSNPEMRPMLQELSSRVPSGRTFSPVADIANVVAFLVSDSARAMHGSCVLADEGYSAGK